MPIQRHDQALKLVSDHRIATDTEPFKQCVVDQLLWLLLLLSPRKQRIVDRDAWSWSDSRWTIWSWSKPNTSQSIRLLLFFFFFFVTTDNQLLSDLRLRLWIFTQIKNVLISSRQPTVNDLLQSAFCLSLTLPVDVKTRICCWRRLLNNLNAELDQETKETAANTLQASLMLLPTSLLLPTLAIGLLQLLNPLRCDLSCRLWRSGSVTALWSSARTGSWSGMIWTSRWHTTPQQWAKKWKWSEWPLAWADTPTIHLFSPLVWSFRISLGSTLKLLCKFKEIYGLLHTKLYKGLVSGDQMNKNKCDSSLCLTGTRINAKARNSLSGSDSFSVLGYKLWTQLGRWPRSAEAYSIWKWII